MSQLFHKKLNSEDEKGKNDWGFSVIDTYGHLEAAQPAGEAGGSCSPQKEVFVKAAQDYAWEYSGRLRVQWSIQCLEDDDSVSDLPMY